MKRNAVALVVLLALMLTALGSLTALAQDGGVSDEEMALLGRVLAAVEKRDTYSSYAVVGHSEEAFAVEVSFFGQSITNGETTITDYERAVIETESGPNVQAVTTVSYESEAAEIGESESSSYTVNAEFRLVDGVLYVNASYEEAEGDVPELPEGWVEVSDALDYPLADVLALSEYQDLGIEDFFADEEDFLKAVTSVTSETGTLEDGTEVEFITIEFGGEGLLASMDLDTDDPMSLAIMQAIMDSGSLMTVVVALDADDNMLGVGLEMDIVLTQDDLGDLMAEAGLPEGTEFSISVSNNTVMEFSNINADMELAVAPE